LIRPSIIMAVVMLLTAADAAAESPLVLKSFVPPEAVVVLGFDLEQGSYEGFGALATNFITRDRAAARLRKIFAEAKVSLPSSAALVLEDGDGRVCTVLRFPDLEDSHWLRLEALMKVGGMVSSGPDAWASAEAESGGSKTSVVRLEEKSVAVGDVELVGIVSSRTRKVAAKRLGDLLEQVPVLATAFFVAARPTKEATSCASAVTAHAVLDKGLLVEMRWDCPDVEAAQAWRDELSAAAKSPETSSEFASRPRVLALWRGALVQRVGDDVMLVATATNESLRALLEEVSTELSLAFDSP